jgi:hypothetical protein
VEFDRNKKPIVIFEKTAKRLRRQDAIANVQGHSSHPVNKVVVKKRILGKRRAEKEERHKGSHTPIFKNQITSL